MKTTVEVLGKKIALELENEDPAYLDKVVKHVNEAAARIARGAHNLSAEKLAIMTAMQVTDEMLRGDGTTDEAKIRALTARIEGAV